LSQKKIKNYKTPYFLQSISFINFIINNASTDNLEIYIESGFHKTYFRELIPATNNIFLWKNQKIQHNQNN